jgi:hypothetical protein
MMDHKMIGALRYFMEFFGFSGKMLVFPMQISSEK